MALEFRGHLWYQEIRARETNFQPIPITTDSIIFHDSSGEWEAESPQGLKFFFPLGTLEASPSTLEELHYAALEFLVLPDSSFLGSQCPQTLPFQVGMGEVGISLIFFSLWVFQFLFLLLYDSMFSMGFLGFYKRMIDLITSVCFRFLH